MKVYGILLVLAVLVTVVGLNLVQAQRNGNPSGTWKAVSPASEWLPCVGFHLQVHGDTLAGAVTDSSGTHKIINGKVEGDIISFQELVFEGVAGRAMTSYVGRLTGDRIKGEVEMELHGKRIVFPWEVERVPTKQFLRRAPLHSNSL